MKRRTVMTLAMLAGLTASCQVFGEWKGERWARNDGCLSFAVTDICIDLGIGVVAAGGLNISTPGGDCASISRVTVTGWVDSNENGKEDEGEQVESVDHEVAEEGGSDHVSMSNISMSTNGNSDGDVHMKVTIERSGSEHKSTFEKVIKKC